MSQRHAGNDVLRPRNRLGGYYQAGKFAPSGRILVFDEENVYGYGRKPQYLRWTTTLEHQLFATILMPTRLPQVRLRWIHSMLPPLLSRIGCEFINAMYDGHSWRVDKCGSKVHLGRGVPVLPKTHSLVAKGDNAHATAIGPKSI